MTDEEKYQFTVLSKPDVNGNMAPERADLLVSVDCVLRSNLIFTVNVGVKRASSTADEDMCAMSYVPS